MKHKCYFIELIFLFTLYPLFAQVDIRCSNDSIYFGSVLKQFAGGNNIQRCKYVKRYVKIENLQNLTVKTEAIDWLGIYRNVIVEKKGDCDSIVYVVCHYDKIDGNIISVLNTLVNGSLDVLLSNVYLSKGAYDNGSGVVTALSLLSWIDSQKTHYTYRFLFAGMEEYGLRGSRRHVSGLKKAEWNRCLYALNIDMVGKKGTEVITVTSNVSDSNLMAIAEEVCKDNIYKLSKAKIPTGALSDYLPFTGQSFVKDFALSFLVNITGSVIPQRSYFTKMKKGIPVINLTDDAKISIPEVISSFSPVAFGEIHSFNDQPKVVDANNLVLYHNFISKFLLKIDNRKSLNYRQGR